MRLGCRPKGGSFGVGLPTLQHQAAKPRSHKPPNEIDRDPLLSPEHGSVAENCKCPKTASAMQAKAKTNGKQTGEKENHRGRRGWTKLFHAVIDMDMTHVDQFRDWALSKSKDGDDEMIGLCMKGCRDDKQAVAKSRRALSSRSQLPDFHRFLVDLSEPVHGLAEF